MHTSVIRIYLSEKVVCYLHVIINGETVIDMQRANVWWYSYLYKDKNQQSKGHVWVCGFAAAGVCVDDHGQSVMSIGHANVHGLCCTLKLWSYLYSCLYALLPLETKLKWVAYAATWGYGGIWILAVIKGQVGVKGLSASWRTGVLYWYLSSELPPKPMQVSMGCVASRVHIDVGGLSCHMRPL